MRRLYRTLVSSALLAFMQICTLSASAASTNSYKDVPYVAGGSASQKLDIFVPNDVKGPVPVVVWIHGGGWIVGDKGNVRYDDVVNRGWALVSINHRTPMEARYPAQLYDCKAAIRFLRANAKQYNLDPNRIAVWGESSGGHLALLLATTSDVPLMEGTVGGNNEFSSAVSGVVNWGGPFNLLSMAGQAKTPAQSFVVSRNGQIAALIGGYAQEHQDWAMNASPVTFASRGDAPALLVHGQHDEIIPTQQSIEAAQRFKAAGAPVHLQVVNSKHDLSSSANRNQALDFFGTCFAGGIAKEIGNLPAVPAAVNTPSSLLPALGFSTPPGTTGGILSHAIVTKHTQRLERAINKVTGAPAGTNQSGQLMQMLNSKTNSPDSKALRWLDQQLNRLAK